MGHDAPPAGPLVLSHASQPTRFNGLLPATAATRCATLVDLFGVSHALRGGEISTSLAADDLDTATIHVAEPRTAGLASRLTGRRARLLRAYVATVQWGMGRLLVMPEWSGPRMGMLTALREDL